jgi:predicted membrane channel-forming protein YqfA (hemolysin III family)
VRVRGRVMIGLLIAAGALPASLYLLQHHEGMNVCVCVCMCVCVCVCVCCVYICVYVRVTPL